MSVLVDVWRMRAKRNRILCSTSVVSWSTTVAICPQRLQFSFGRKYLEFCSASDPSFITFHVTHHGGAWISVQIQDANVLFTDGMITERSPDCFMLY